MLSPEAMVCAYEEKAPRRPLPEQQEDWAYPAQRAREEKKGTRAMSNERQEQKETPETRTSGREKIWKMKGL